MRKAKRELALLESQKRIWADLICGWRWLTRLGSLLDMLNIPKRLVGYRDAKTCLLLWWRIGIEEGD